MPKSKTFPFQICHMSPKARRKAKFTKIRKSSERCPAGKVVKCSRKKGMGYCGKSSRKK
jgi:hypothetical protein